MIGIGKPLRHECDLPQWRRIGDGWVCPDCEQYWSVQTDMVGWAGWGHAPWWKRLLMRSGGVK